MEVRENVFVQEQKVPLENEQDSDDARSCHWVVYASVNKTEETEVRDEDGNVIQPRKSSTRTTPIGTLRLIPFPHSNHPKIAGDYWNGELQNGHERIDTPDSSSSSGTVGSDRSTSFHDGKEPYVKLGRLAVVKEFRGNGLAGLLVQTALSWLKSNPSFFDPSITELGLEQVGASTETEIPKWGGLVCVHAQEQVVATWAKLGFQVDKGMGRWCEEGMPHVGMFQRLKISPKDVRI
jgi:predicted GNAT family N-acyltransferase